MIKLQAGAPEKPHYSIAVISRRVYSIFRNYCTVKPLNYMRYLNIN